MPHVDHIAHYRILRRIGRGGQATVYLAEDTKLQRQVALKVLDSGPGSHSQAIDRFRREADIASKLDHPGICPVYQTGDERGVLWIAMRYVEGRTLAQHVATARSGPTEAESFVEMADDDAPAAPAGPSGWPSGPGTWTAIEQTLVIFEKAARALHAAHEAGIVHRDIKPGNIMVTNDGDPVILDFGLAQEIDGDHPTLTLTGDMMGTPAYMSPEQIAAQRIRLDRRTDVYSLGVALYECVTLRRPFDEPTRERLYQAILTKKPADPRELNPALPRDLTVVLETTLEKDRDRRYQTARDFADDLERLRKRSAILAKPIGPLVRVGRWGRRNPALATAVGGLFAVLVAGLVVTQVLLHRSETERRAKEKALGEVTTQRNEKEAALIQVTAERNQKELALSDYDRLGDLSRLQRLQAEADGLWPAEPSNLPAMKAWLDQAAALAERLDGHRRLLEELRESGTKAAIDATAGESPADAPLTWRFTSDAAQFKHDTTAKLVAELTAFVEPDPKTGLMADVRGRLAFAETVQHETVGRYETQWADAIRSIADRTECPGYDGLRITPQIGLVPIARDPASGLWEFAHLQTAAPGTEPIPERDERGRLVVTQSMGLIFVLIPGGTFRMGATRPGEDQALTDPNVDRDADSRESPVTDVALDPFFMSKYEMTQGQWVRTVGKNPSAYRPGISVGGKVVDLRNPVEQVSWEDCELWLGRLGLIVPTEAQWEYGARGGTTTPRWTGIGTEPLAKAANLADAFCRQNGGQAAWKYESWNDGYTLHAAAGSFAPNPFGLHDVFGNVWEWCRDWHGRYDVPACPGDGLRSPASARNRVHRGGSFNNDASSARSACRAYAAPENRFFCFGVRPARTVVHD